MATTPPHNITNVLSSFYSGFIHQFAISNSQMGRSMLKCIHHLSSTHLALWLSHCHIQNSTGMYTISLRLLNLLKFFLPHDKGPLHMQLWEICFSHYETKPFKRTTALRATVLEETKSLKILAGQQQELQKNRRSNKRSSFNPGQGVKTVRKSKFQSAEEMRKMWKDIGIREMEFGFNLCVAPSPRNQVVPDFG